MNIQKFLLIIFFVKTFFQVRSLYDGLSHLYTDCDSRLRHIPSTNYADKKRKDESTGKKSILHTFNFTNFFINFYEFHEKKIFIYDGLTFFVASNPNDPNTETGDQRVKSPEAPVSPRISSR